MEVKGSIPVLLGKLYTRLKLTGDNCLGLERVARIKSLRIIYLLISLGKKEFQNVHILRSLFKDVLL